MIETINAFNDHIEVIFFTEKSIRIYFETVDDKDICIIKVTKSIRIEDAKLYFFRNSQMTRELDTREVIERIFLLALIMELRN
ncbi:MAG: hypothetical protein DRR08_03065 [Candidatus Parabeggiatoa sp. nov. 2]|nr:MAG: hypothetical protein B6247_09125 [Beggiatoa sp. 4572_84]RKZ63565.1 MAG: hypothetical protein DRR08_03065 [Gammaproteobacteria bacterium]